MKKLILIGSGGHGKVVLDVMLAQGEYELAGIGDDKYTGVFWRNGIPLGPIADIAKLLKDEDCYLMIAIGSNRSRKSVMARIGFPPSKYAVLVHPAAIIGSRVTIGRGSVVMPGAVINYGAHIGEHCIINSSAVIEHGNSIGNFVHISPGAALAGDVIVGDGVHVGIGANIVEGICIGGWSTLGAGAVAIGNIPGQCTAVGVPAKPIKYVEDGKLQRRRA